VKKISGYIVAVTPAIATSLKRANPAVVVVVQLVVPVATCPVRGVAVSIPVSILLRFVAFTAGVTTTMYPTVAFTTASYVTAVDANIALCETYAGGIRLYADAVPASTVTFDYVVIRG